MQKRRMQRECSADTTSAVQSWLCVMARLVQLMKEIMKIKQMAQSQKESLCFLAEEMISTVEETHYELSCVCEEEWKQRGVENYATGYSSSLE